MEAACCIIGAGYSFVAGIPLAKDLLDSETFIGSRKREARFRAVWEDYDKWRRDRESDNPEEYLADLYDNFMERPGPPFSWAVELVAAVIASPRYPETTFINPRYGLRITTPSRCREHVDFWTVVTGTFPDVSVITTNYDLCVERALRHRPMERVFAPGCYYGGLPRPQQLKGLAMPFRGNRPQRWVELTGSVPVYKLHGSLNWSRGSAGLDLSQDLRPAFRRAGDSAIIPPMSEKRTPAWLRGVWAESEACLAEAGWWIVCGYSFPDYDRAIGAMLRRASRGRRPRLLILDPCSDLVAGRAGMLAPHLDIVCLPGLPDGTAQLRTFLEAHVGRPDPRLGAMGSDRDH